jgi:hypothetical protein
MLALALTTTAAVAYAVVPSGDDGDKVKVKIVKIVDGDTTTIEKVVSESELTKLNEEMNNVKGKNVKVMMYVNSLDEKKEGATGSPQEKKVTMSKSFSFDFDSVMKTCKIEMNVDSLISSAMSGFNMTVITDDEEGKDGKKEKKVIIKKGNGSSSSYSYSFNLDSLEQNLKQLEIEMEKFEKDGNKTIIITTPDNKDGKKGENKIIIKKGSSGYIYNSDGEEIDIQQFEGDGDGKSSTIIITSPDEKDGKKVIVRSSVVVIDDKDKSKKKKRKEKEGSSHETADDLKFYPNPSDGKFTVEYDLKTKEPATLTILDANGKLLFEEEIKGGGKYTKQIDLGGKGKGVFILNLKQGKKSISRKIVIE